MTPARPYALLDSCKQIKNEADEFAYSHSITYISDEPRKRPTPFVPCPRYNHPLCIPAFPRRIVDNVQTLKLKDYSRGTITDQAFLMSLLKLFPGLKVLEFIISDHHTVQPRRSRDPFSRRLGRAFISLRQSDQPTCSVDTSLLNVSCDGHDIAKADRLAEFIKLADIVVKTRFYFEWPKCTYPQTSTWMRNYGLSFGTDMQIGGVSEPSHSKVIMLEY